VSGRLVGDVDVFGMDGGDCVWAFGGDWRFCRSLRWNLAAAVRFVGQGKVGRCGGASVGDLAVLGARAEPFSCPDWSTNAYNNSKESLKRCFSSEVGAYVDFCWGSFDICG